MIKEYVIKKALDAAFDVAKKVLRESGGKLNVTKEDVEQSISYHLRSVKNWSAEVSFRDLKKAKRTTDIYIELDLFILPRRVRIYRHEVVESIPLRDIFEFSTNHFVLLGQPGAGKTTSMKHLCQTLFLDPNFHSDRFSFPILIKLRDIKRTKRTPESSILIDQLYNILGLKLNLPDNLLKDEAAADRKDLKEKLVINFLEEMNVLLVLDGFDELSKLRYRDEAIKGFTNLATHLDRSSMIITSRTGDFIYNIENTVQFEICSLSKEQVSKFASKWLADEQRASDFLKKVYDSPFADTMIRPLTLAHLCAIYERIGNIPDKPKTTYKKIIGLLLEEWDQQRSVKRESRYANFEVDRKFEFLCNLAYVLTTSLQRTVFSTKDLLGVYKSIYQDYDLVGHEAQQVVNELETHTGLLLQSGYEEFEFAHKSLQEFLTAEYLVKLPSIPTNSRIISKLPNELAIAVTISSSPSEYFSELVLHRLKSQKLSEGFVKTFLSRLLLEKPDFNTSAKLGLALVLLYTIYVECNVISGNQLRFFYIDRVINEFEKMIKLVLRRSSIDILQKYYETEFNYEMEDQDNLRRMIKRDNVRDVKLPIAQSELPKIIYVRDSFLVEASGSSQKSN